MMVINEIQNTLNMDSAKQTKTINELIHELGYVRYLKYSTIQVNFNVCLTWIDSGFVHAITMIFKL